MGGWLGGWEVGWEVGWGVGWGVGKLVGRLVGRLGGWLGDWLGGWLGGGGGQSTFLHDLKAPHQRFVNPQARRLCLDAFAMASSLPLEMRHLKPR